MEWDILSKKLDNEIKALFENNPYHSSDIIKERVNNFARKIKNDNRFRYNLD